MIALIGLIINAQYIQLVHEEQVTMQAGYANILNWEGGTMVYAHNYLDGGLFYEIDSVTAVYSDGSMEPMEIRKRMVYTGVDWAGVITDHSSDESITLVTCYPQVGTTSWRLLVELQDKKTIRHESFREAR